MTIPDMRLKDIAESLLALLKSYDVDDLKNLDSKGTVLLLDILGDYTNTLQDLEIPDPLRALLFNNTESLMTDIFINRKRRVREEINLKSVAESVDMIMNDKKMDLSCLDIVNKARDDFAKEIAEQNKVIEQDSLKRRDELIEQNNKKAELKKLVENKIVELQQEVFKVD